MALVLYRPAFWIFLIIQTTILVWLARRFQLRWLPALPLRAFLLGGLLFVVFYPSGQFTQQSIPARQVLLVDVSDSIPSDIRESFREQIPGWQSPGNNRQIIAFGAESAVVFSASSPWLQIDGRSSRLDKALDRAENLLAGSSGNIVLISDGLASSEGDIDSALNRLADQGHRLDVIPIPSRDSMSDLFVGQLSVATSLWENTPFSAVLPVYAPLGGDIRVQLKVDGKEVFDQVEQVVAGENFIPFFLQANGQEIMTLEALVEMDGDQRIENNRAYAAVQVFPSPRVLFITKIPDQGSKFVGGLRTAGLQVDVIDTDQLTSDTSALEEYKVIFLHNLLALDLTEEQMLTLKVFVAKLGGGLVFLGGNNSYTLGGYKNTILEPILPVKLEPPPRKERPPVTFVLVLDHSNSMKPFTVGIQPIDLAKEAAIRAIETLTAEDYLGVLTFNSDYGWDVHLEEAGEGLVLRNAMDAISRIRASGGTKMFAALEEALSVLSETHTSESRHILLLSDGKSEDGDEESFRMLAERALKQDITISTIALGDRADRDLMAMISDVAKGRYHLVLEPAELPRVMISESRAVLGENVQVGQTGLKLGEQAHPVLAGFRPDELPKLTAYNALISKADMGAEDILVSSSFGDPILSAWQYELGRVVAWMGDIGEEWAGDWTDWSKLGLFWSQVVRYALLNPALGPVQVDIQVGDTQVKVEALIQDDLGLLVNNASSQFSYVDFGGTVHRFAVPQISPGHYSIELPRLAEGAYRAVLTYRDKKTTTEIPAYFSVNYPKEWQPASTEQGRNNLSRWAGMTGGREITFADLHRIQETTKTTTNFTSLWWRLLVGAIIFWPAEIAIRRRWLPWN
jgi:uncharacterized membrane protein